jgi:hypothetical protein
VNSDDVSAASFRDPSGFVFRQDGLVYRQINPVYAAHYDHLHASGLYDTLTRKHLLIPHTEASLDLARTPDAYRIIQPEPIDLISYPYEWSFGQLKDAALTTLRIQRLALKHDMILKDASAYNIQFVAGKPVFIDTLSFEIYREGQLWDAYRQFCQHFLAPLALMAYKDVRLGTLSRQYIDGVPLDLAASLLPKRTWLRLGLALHLHLHSRAQSRYTGKGAASEASQSKPAKTRTLSRKALLNIVESLQGAVKSLRWKAAERTSWADYYEGDSYDSTGFDDKQAIVARFIEQVDPASAWDLGANTGVFSRLCAERDIPTVAWDIDPGAVELNYREVKGRKETHLLPLIIDLANPSPGIGWANAERESFAERGGVDLVLALALIHHLAISNNTPLEQVARFMSRLGEHLIIEFVPKEDPKVQILMASRRDIFPTYTREGFETAFEPAYDILDSQEAGHSMRRLYLMRKK